MRVPLLLSPAGSQIRYSPDCQTPAVGAGVWQSGEYLIWDPAGESSRGTRIGRCQNSTPKPAPIQSQYKESSMNRATSVRDERRFIGLDVHKHYVTIGGMNLQQELVL